MNKWNKGVILVVFLLLITNVSATYRNVADNRSFSSINEICPQNTFNSSAYDNFIIDFSSLDLNPCENYETNLNKDIFTLFFIEETEFDFLEYREYSNKYDVDYFLKNSDKLLLGTEPYGLENWETSGQKINLHLLLNDKESSYVTENYGNCTISYTYNSELEEKSLGKILDEFGILSSNSGNMIPKDVCNNLNDIYFLDKLVKLYALKENNQIFSSFSNLNSSNFDISKLSYTTSFIDESGKECNINLYLLDVIGNPIKNLSNYTLSTSNYDISTYNNIEYFNISVTSKDEISETIKYFDIAAGTFNKDSIICENSYDQKVSLMQEINISIFFYRNDELNKVSGEITTDFGEKEIITNKNNLTIENKLFFKCSGDASLIENKIYFDSDNYALNSLNCFCDNDNYKCNINLENDFDVNFNLFDKDKDKLTDFYFEGKIENKENTYENEELNFKISQTKNKDEINNNFDFFNNDWKLSGKITGPYGYIYNIQTIEMEKSDNKGDFNIYLDNYPMTCNEFSSINSYSSFICSENEYCNGNIYLLDNNCCYSAGTYNREDLCIDSTSSTNDIDKDGIPDVIDACPTEPQILSDEDLIVSEDGFCNDGIDNDCDLLKDGEDPDCNEDINCLDDCNIENNKIDFKCNNQITNWIVPVNGNNEIAYSLIDNSKKVCCLNPIKCDDGKYYCGQCPISIDYQYSETSKKECFDGLDNDADGYIDSCDDGCITYYEELINQYDISFEEYNSSKTVNIYDYKNYDIFGDNLDNNCNGVVDESIYTLIFTVTDKNLNPINNSLIKILEDELYNIQHTDEKGKGIFYLSKNPYNKEFEVSKESEYLNSYYVVNKSKIICYKNDATQEYKGGVCNINVTIEKKTYNDLSITIKDSITNKYLDQVSINCNESPEIYYSDNLGEVSIQSKINKPICKIYKPNYQFKEIIIEDNKEIQLIPLNNVVVNLIEKETTILNVNYEMMQYLNVTLPIADDFNVTINGEEIYFYNKNNALILLNEYFGTEIKVNINSKSYGQVEKYVLVSPIGCMINKDRYIKENKVFVCSNIIYNDIKDLKNNILDIEYITNPSENEYVRDVLISPSKLLEINNKLRLGILESNCEIGESPIIKDEKSYCAKEDDCYKETGLLSAFSFFRDFFSENLEKRYCYYDIDLKTNFETMKNCKNIDSCYNYLSQEACQQNECSINLDDENKGCNWNTYNEFGVTKGMCVPNYDDNNYNVNNFNCSYNNTQNHDLLFEGTNLFDFYSKNTTFDLCQIKGNIQNSKENNTCYFTYSKNYNELECINKNDRNCEVFRTQEDCNGLVNFSYDISNNNYFTKSQDSSNYGWCKWLEEEDRCIKDIDMDNIDDCNIENYTFYKVDNECYENLEWLNIVKSSGDVIKSDNNIVFTFNNSDEYFNLLEKDNKLDKNKINFFLYFDNNTITNNNINNDLFNFNSEFPYNSNTQYFDVFDTDPELNKKEIILTNLELKNGYHNMSYIVTEKITKGMAGEKNNLIYFDSEEYREEKVSTSKMIYSIEVSSEFNPKISLKEKFTFNISEETYLMCNFSLRNETNEVNYLLENEENNKLLLSTKNYKIFEIYNDEQIKQIDIWDTVNITGNIKNYTNKKYIELTTNVLPEGDYSLKIDCVDATKEKTTFTKNFNINNSFFFSEIEPFGPILETNNNKFDLNLKTPLDSVCDIYQMNQSFENLFFNQSINLEGETQKTINLNFLELNDYYKNQPIDNLIWLNINCTINHPFYQKYSVKVPIIKDDKSPIIEIWDHDKNISNLEFFDISKYNSAIDLTFRVKDKNFDITQEIISKNKLNQIYYEQLMGYYRSDFDFTNFLNEKTGESGLFNYDHNYVKGNSFSIPYPVITEDNTENEKIINYTYSVSSNSIFNLSFIDNANNEAYKEFVIIKDNVAPIITELEGNKIKKINDIIYFNSNDTIINLTYLNYYSDDKNKIDNLNSYIDDISILYDLNYSSIDNKVLKTSFDKKYFEEFKISDESFKIMYKEESGNRKYIRLYHNDTKLLEKQITINSLNKSLVLEKEFSNMMQLNVEISRINGEYFFIIKYNSSNNQIEFNKDFYTQSRSHLLSNEDLFKNKISNFYIYINKFQTKTYNIYLKDIDNGVILWEKSNFNGNQKLTETLNNIPFNFEKRDNIELFICDKVNNCNSYKLEELVQGTFFEINADLYNSTTETLVNYTIDNIDSVLGYNFERVELYQKAYYRGNNDKTQYPSYEYYNIEDINNGNSNLVIFKDKENSKSLNLEGIYSVDFINLSLSNSDFIKLLKNYSLDIKLENGNYLYNVTNLKPTNYEDQGFKINNKDYYFTTFDNKSFFYQNEINNEKLTLNLSKNKSFKTIQTYKKIATNNTNENGSFVLSETGEYLLVGVLKSEFDVLSYNLVNINYDDEINPKIEYISLENTTEINNKNITNESIGINFYVYDKNLFNITAKIKDNQKEIKCNRVDYINSPYTFKFRYFCNFTLDINELKSGLNNIIIKAIDYSGNIEQESFDIYRDTYEPTVEIN